jgi:ribulose-phosphate 3-epimerase
MTMRVGIVPSILAADFARLGEQVRDAEEGGADRIHVDVMDGRFVPNLSMGPPVVASLRKVTRLPLEIHLMITYPDCFLKLFAGAGSDSFIVHWEGNLNLHRTVHSIRMLGKRAGVAINPATPADVLTRILPDIDQVLVMTVDPGFGHQQFLPSALTKIREVRTLIDRLNQDCDLEVDGGIDHNTARLAFEAGANIFVAGTSVFGDPGGPAAGIHRLRGAGCQPAADCQSAWPVVETGIANSKSTSNPA